MVFVAVAFGTLVLKPQLHYLLQRGPYYEKVDFLQYYAGCETIQVFIALSYSKHPDMDQANGRTVLDDGTIIFSYCEYRIVEWI